MKPEKRDSRLRYSYHGQDRILAYKWDSGCKRSAKMGRWNREGLPLRSTVLIGSKGPRRVTLDASLFQRDVPRPSLLSETSRNPEKVRIETGGKPGSVEPPECPPTG